MAWRTQDDLGLDVATLHAEVDRERRHAFSVAALGVSSIYIQTRGDHMERTLPTHATTVHASTYGQAAAGVGLLLAAVVVQMVGTLVLLVLLVRRRRPAVARVQPCDHLSPPPSPLGEDTEEQQQPWWSRCPKCSKTFTSYRGYRGHMGRNRLCDAARRKRLQDRDTVEEKEGCAMQEGALEEHYKNMLKLEVNKGLSDLRVDRLIGGANTDYVKVTQTLHPSHLTQPTLPPTQPLRARSLPLSLPLGPPTEPVPLSLPLTLTLTLTRT